MEKTRDTRRKRRKPALLPRLLLALIVLLLAVIVLVWGINRWTVDLTLNGDNPATIEYASDYTDPGASATLRGTLFCRNGKPVKVKTKGKVDTKTLGEQDITYSARFLFTSRKETRSVTVADTTPPKIELKTDPTTFTLPNHEYKEEGFTAEDNYDGDLTDKVERSEKDDVITYTVTDSSGNTATETRKIVYGDPEPPKITLKGSAIMTMKAGDAFKDPGFTATDNADGDVTDKVKVKKSDFTTYSAGKHTLTYEVKDTYGNKAKATRTVLVRAAEQPEVKKPEGKVVYLTFDDGPSQYTRKLMDVLDKYNAKATFFLVNTDYTDIIKEEHERGHAVAIHSATHDYPTIYSSEEAYFKDLHKMQDIIEKKCGVKTTMLRFPGGSSNMVSAHYSSGIMTRLVQDVTDQGFQYFAWNVASGDAGETTSTARVAQNVINGIQNQDVSVVLQHDIKGFSVDAVEDILKWGQAHGYSFQALQPDSPPAHHPVNN